MRGSSQSSRRAATQNLGRSGRGPAKPLGVLARRVAARLAAGGERKGHLHRLLRRLREVKLCDLRLLEMLAAVGDLADARRPPPAALEDDRRLELVRDGELV